MRPPFLHGRRFVRAAAFLLVAALLAGASECTYRGKPIGGGTPDQFTQGTVTGFGSVYVAGVEYAAPNGTITLDGASAAEADLRPGHVVSIKGRLTSGTTTAGRADSLTADAAVAGTVDTRDAAAGTITVLGTGVQLYAGTSFGTGIDGAATTPFAIGDRVIVHGYSGSGTAVLATRIERAAAARELQVAGRIASLDAGARRYTVRGTTVDYAAADSVSGLRDGAFALATGTSTAADGSLRARRVTVRDEAPAAERDQGDVEGVIARYASATDFDVGGRTITTTSSTTYTNGTATDLRAGVLLTVRGRFDANAKLVASSVEFSRAANFRMLAPIEFFDVPTTAFAVGGVQVRTTSRTRWEDRSVQGSRTFRYAELRSGEWLDTRGVEESATRTATAVVVERRDFPADQRIELQGLARSVQNPALMLVGVPVVTTEAEFRDRAGAVLTRAQFFSQARDQVVVARGRFSGVTLVADSLQLRP